MNKHRRKEIQDIIQSIDIMKFRIEAVAEEEQEYFDNMPESIQEGEKGDLCQEKIAALEYAADFDEVVSNLEEAMS